MLVKCRKCFKRGQIGDHLDQKGFLPFWSDITRLLQCPGPTPHEAEHAVPMTACKTTLDWHR